MIRNTPRHALLVLISISLLPATASAQGQITSYLFAGGNNVVAPPPPDLPPLNVSSPLTFNFTVLSDANPVAMLAHNAGSAVDTPTQVLPNGMKVPMAGGGGIFDPPLESNGGLTFNLTSTGDPDADAGFARAATYLESQFVDAGVVVNITAGFAALPAGVLGSAGSTQSSYIFSAWKTAVAGDILTTDDTTFSTNLPSGSSYSKYINRTSDNPDGSGSATPYVHIGAESVRLTNANAKALGLITDPAQDGEDAAITFSTLFTWDFDPSDGIDPGAIDFVGVAIHELMHAMGFTSGVDILDINSPPVNGPFPGSAFDPYATGLDFARHSDASLTAGADMDWTADTRTKLYSIDAGTTTILTNGWSTGVNFGDGNQASHWKDNLGIGIMDPTSVPAGSANVVTDNDLQALDVIGWNPVPEPSTFLLAAIGLVSLVAFGRRRRPAV